MKIAVDCRMIRHSGIGTVLRELLPFLLQSGHRFLLLGDPALLAVYVRLGAEVYPFHEPVYSVSEQVCYPRRALKGLDVLLFPHYNVPFPAPLPLVTVIHDLAPLALPQFFSGPAKRLYAHLFFRLAVKRSAAVIAVSRFTRREIMTRLGAEPSRIRMIHNGPGRSFPHDSDLSMEALQRHGITPPYVLAVGNLKPHKNLKKLVEAFAILRQHTRGRLSLVIAGRAFPDRTTGTAPSSLTPGELHASGIVFPGFVPDEDMPALYRHADLLLLPSLYEGFGLTALEALRFGTLPLVADTASLPEVIDDPELRFDPNDAEAMVEKIRYFLNHPDVRASKIAAQQRSTVRFSWEAAALHYLEVLREVASRHHLDKVGAI